MKTLGDTITDGPGGRNMKQKTVVITGAGSGIGKALAEIFKKNGWDTIARTHPELDITDQKSIENFSGEMKGKPVDVLVNNAGIYDYLLENESYTNNIGKITDVFSTNTIGAKVLSEYLVPNLLAGEEKLVVSVSSVMGTYRSLSAYSADHWSYSASKAALNFAMISFALSHPEIKSVLVHPGWVKTKIGGKGAQLEPEFSAGKIYDLIADHRNRLPNKKLVDYEGRLMDF